MKGIKKGLAILLVLCTLLSMVVMTGAAAPDGGSTNNQPFASGTGNSQYFRIPAMVTLSDGTLVAAADARWNGTGDAGGIDTMVSRSTDGGKTWTYSFANYLGDNNQQFDKDCATFIDPALAYQAGTNTLYMLVDLYAAGYAINTAPNKPLTGSGFTSDGRLKVQNASEKDNYTYYVGDYSPDGYANIYDANNQAVSDYTVDKWFNLYQNGSEVSNLFYANAAYKAYPTTYLYLTKSTDGGQTWGAPELLNVKNAGEMFYGVGPGGGIVTSTGRIIFPCYTYANGDDGKTSVIYSDDSGKTWKRSADMNVQTSEASISEVTLDGQNYLYMFTRHGGYFVSSDNGASWSNRQTVSDISYTTSCELSTLTYSKTIDGRPAILLSAPTGSSRANGKIFVGLVQDNGSIEWKYTYAVTSGTYQYSDLTELKDGSIGLLYENSSGQITYTNLAINTIAPAAQIGTAVETPDNSDVTATNTKDVTVYIGQSTTITDPTGNHGTRTVLDNQIAKVTTEGTTVEGGTSVTKVASITSGDSYLISDGNGNYLTLSGNTVTNSTDPSTATKWTITKSDNGYYTIKSGNSTLSLYNYNNYSFGPNVTDTKNIYWSYDSTKGIGDPWGWGYNLYYENGWKVGPTSSGYGAAYLVESTDPVDATDITITGVTVGSTSVVVGNTKYNITVKEVPAVVDADSTPFRVGSNQTGSGNILTKLTLSVALTYDIDLAKGVSGGTWSIEDTSIATVDKNGVVTGVKTGETTLTYTGSDGVVYRIPVVIVQNTTSSSTKICSLHISEITDTDVWYSWNCSGSESEFIQAVNGEAIYVSYSSSDAYCINFYGAPHEGYALTLMSATNSQGQYLALDDKADPQKCDFYNDPGAGKNERDNPAFGDTKVTADIQAALNLGCDGAQGFSRAYTNSGPTNCDLTFRSQKLPTVEKSIKTVNGKAYTEGMTAKEGDKIVYDVTVTQYATTEAITYSNVILEDKLDGAQFSTNRNSTVNPSLRDSTLTANQTYKYEVTYTIKDEDLDKDIVNTVDLNYNYKAKYSSGTFGGSASAQAKISAPTFTPKDIVIDFGLPVAIDYSGADAHGRYDIKSGTATYGTVTVDHNVVTYTPNTVLKGIDTVTLTNTADGTTTFKVYPATTVYYEEGFATPYADKGIATGNKGTGTQAAEAVGGQKYVYGYDPAYQNAIPSALTDGTIELDAAGEGVSFEFTGTGVDIYTNSSPQTGTVMVYVYKGTGANKQFKQLISVDTAMRNGGTGATAGQAVTAYNVPIVSLSGLTHSDYTVEVDVVNSKVTNENGTTTKQILPVYIDGFRVHGTLDVNSDVYQQDGEANPTFVELRNAVLAGLNVAEQGQYADQIAANAMSQVYAKDEAGKGAVVFTKGSTNSTVENYNVQDLLDNGPKNEFYLFPGQTVVFKIADEYTNPQIGLKALNDSVKYTINDEPKTLTTSTDMFYPLTLASDRVVTITNNGAGILSITEIKAFADAANGRAMFAALSEADLMPALLSLGYEAEPVAATATLNITVQCGDKAIPVVLTAEGMSNETHTFTAAEIKAAVEQALPEGYTVEDVTFTDVTVACGEASEVTFSAAEIPAAPVSVFQKIVQTAVKIVKKIFGWF